MSCKCILRSSRDKNWFPICIWHSFVKSHCFTSSTSCTLYKFTIDVRHALHRLTCTINGMQKKATCPASFLKWIPRKMVANTAATSPPGIRITGAQTQENVACAQDDPRASSYHSLNLNTTEGDKAGKKPQNSSGEPRVHCPLICCRHMRSCTGRPNDSWICPEGLSHGALCLRPLSIKILLQMTVWIKCQFFPLLFIHFSKQVWPGLCCLMTPGLSKDIRCYVWPYFFLKLANARSDIRPHIKWAVSLVFANGHFNIPLGCEWVYMD